MADNILVKNEVTIDFEAMPHVGEAILRHIETHGLLQCRFVSETWKEIAEEILVKRLNGLNNGKTIGFPLVKMEMKKL